MSYLRLTILACCLAPGTALASDGGVHLYLQPLPAEAARLTFTVGALSAVEADGSEYPLKVALPTLTRAVVARQRLLASGRVPVGSYVGFRLTVSRARLAGGPGDGSLQVPDAPLRLDIPFTITPPDTALFWLTLKYDPSIAAGAAFVPSFAVITPPAPNTDHLGMVSSTRANSLTFFDKTTGQAVAVLDTCARPEGMALDRHRRRVYVACSRDDEIQAIDITGMEVLERGRLFPGDGPREVALTPDGAVLVSVSAASNTVTFFDAVTLDRQERVAVGGGPTSVLIDPTGRRAYVFNTLSNSVSIIEIASRSLVGTLSVDSSPVRGQFNARGDRLYVIHERSPFMTVVDPRQLSIVTRARVRSGITAIAVDWIRSLVYLGGPDDRTIEFYDPNALVPVYSVNTPRGASYLAIDAEESTLYAVSPDTASVVVTSLADRKLVAEIDVGEGPYWVAVMGER